MSTNDTRLPRSFSWLNVTQFLGALNDNVFRFLVIYFLVVGLNQMDQRSVVMLIAGIAFVLPFLLFSHAAGVLADKLSKRSIIVFSKILEVVVMVLGALAIHLQSAVGLYALIFLMSTQSAIFGPSKYGIIPELVASDKLSRANSYLVGVSYLAIILGTFIPSYFLLRILDHNFLGVAFFCVAISVLGVLACLQIEKTRPTGKGKRFSPLFFVEIFRTLNSVRPDRYLFLTILGISYFLYLGGFMQQNLLIYGADYLKLGWIESGYLFPVAALGIGVGALLSGKMSGRNIEFGVVPMGALGLTVCCLVLGLIPPGIISVLVIMFIVGVSAGLFIVPLNAFVQFRSPPERRGEILACVNFFSFVGFALSAASIVLLDKVLVFTPNQSFLVIGILTGLLAVAAFAILPDFVVRFIIVLIAKAIYRITVRGRENIPLEGPALLVSNHVTWVDSLVIAATQQRRIRFVMSRETYDRSPMKWIFNIMGVILVSPKDGPRKVIESLRRARAALDDNYLVCIFAEGAITRNGNMFGFRPGLERIVKGTNHPIIPVYIGNAWGSIFSYYSGKLVSTLPSKVPYPVSIIFGKPMPTPSSTAQVRDAVLQLSTEAFDLKKSPDRTLPRQFLRTARRNWNRTALYDTTGKRLTFGKTLVGALVLADEIGTVSQGQDKIGILLPASVGGALANIAVAMLGKVSVNLNFTASAEATQSAIEQCNIRTVISSRAFIEKLENFPVPQGTVMLEDITTRVTGATRLRALLKACFVPFRYLVRDEQHGPDDPATIIFSSGSTGKPKGVMLSHHNIISNIEAFLMVVKFGPNDRMCGTLPLFHSFGFTCTLWCPLVRGFSSWFHPNPLDTAKIAEMIRENKLTALLATPTFLLGYIRRAKREDLASLRLVIVGAEKLKKRVADAFEDKFGIRPLEGYGATELSPVAALNLPDIEADRIRQTGNKPDSIGHPIPGVAARIVDPDTFEPVPAGQQGLLIVKGPNVMLGYLNNPEKTVEAIKNGWYNTGDLAKMDDDGFIFLLDRLSRYSKIGGEMVPHVAVEERLLQSLDTVERVVAVTSAPDEKKGEQLVVVYTDAAGDPRELHRIIKESDLPNLWKPKKENYVRTESMPALGSGKLDLQALKKLAKEYVENRPGIMQRAIDKIKEAL